LPWISQDRKLRFDRAFVALQSEARNRRARTSDNIMPPNGRQATGNAAADAAEPHDRNFQSPRLRPRHGAD
jgi:hypothetical protein